MNLLSSSLEPAPAAVITAMEHVRSHHPQVTRVIFDQDSRWLYLDDTGGHPVFGPATDVGILEDAADAVSHLPAVYEIARLPAQ